MNNDNYLQIDSNSASWLMAMGNRLVAVRKIGNSINYLFEDTEKANDDLDTLKGASLVNSIFYFTRIINGLYKKVKKNGKPNYTFTIRDGDIPTKNNIKKGDQNND